MNIKQLLENYTEYKAQKIILEKELEEIDLQRSYIGSQAYSDMPKSLSNESKIEKIIIKDENYMRKTKQEIKRIESKIEVIAALINTLDELEKRVIVMRYLDKKAWNSIICETDRTYSRVRGIANQGISKMQKLYEKTLK